MSCVLAIGVCAALSPWSRCSTCEDLSPDALARDTFALGAAALFLAAAVLRIARWRVTTDPHSGLLGAAMVALCLITLPLGNLAGLGLAARALGTAVCLALALRAMTVTDEGRPTSWARTLLVSAVTALVGLAGLAGLAAVTPERVSGPALLGAVVEVALAGTWLAIGLAASLRDAVQPWAGRVAPLYASLGLVELLHALDQLRPGAWALPSSALLASVAMITAHSAYVDLLDAARLAAAVDQRTRQISLGTQVDAEDAGDRAGRPTSTSPRWWPPPCSPASRPARRSGSAAVPASRTRAPATWPWRSSGCSPTRRPTRPTARSPCTSSRSAGASRSPWPTAGRACQRSTRTGPVADLQRLGARRTMMARNGGRLELRNRIGGTTFVLVLPAAEDQRTKVTCRAGTP